MECTKCKHGSDAPTVCNTPSCEHKNRFIRELPVEHPADLRHECYHPSPLPELMATSVDSLANYDIRPVICGLPRGRNVSNLDENYRG